MGGTGKNNESPEKESDAPVKPAPAPNVTDDIEDGDIATPKPNRDGDDDEPL
jgi:hypothetical protein